MAQSKDMDSSIPTPPSAETPHSQPTEPVIPITAVVDPYAPIDAVQSVPTYTSPAYGGSQPNTVAEQISTLGQAEQPQPPAPIVPLAHVVEEPTVAMPMPVGPVAPVVAPAPVEVEPVKAVPTAAVPEVVATLPRSQQSLKVLILLVLVFVVLFGLAAVLGYMVGSHQG